MAKSSRRSTKVVTMPTRVSPHALSQSPSPADSDIARRAFELYCERGCQPGRDVEDWLQAERELREEANSRAALPELSAASATLEEVVEPAAGTA